MSKQPRTLDHHFGPDARDERNKQYKITRIRQAAAPAEASWRGGPVLDQGNTGHCGGFGAADEAGASPVRVRVTDAWAHAFYYEIKDRKLDPWGREDGTSVQAVMKLGQLRGLWSSYGWATSLDELDAGLDIGPAIVGTSWKADMFSPSKGGMLTISGDDEGGHCYAVTGRLLSPVYGPLYRIRNSWGHGWGVGGNAYVRREAFGELLFGGDGEASFPVHRSFPKG